jgi:hypothetical protein
MTTLEHIRSLRQRNGADGIQHRHLSGRPGCGQIARSNPKAEGDAKVKT